MGLIEDAKRIEAGIKLAAIKQRVDDLIASANAAIAEMEVLKAGYPKDAAEIDAVMVDCMASIAPKQ